MEVMLENYSLNQETFVEIPFTLNRTISIGDNLLFTFGSQLQFSQQLIQCQLLSRYGIQTDQVLVENEKGEIKWGLDFSQKGGTCIPYILKYLRCLRFDY
ncbi:UNKNOWN [Stylonychia lemnae]|uniref:Uncharacterized protein n=1 Tax=Stylonychia lemnae TaxID=5949 RepID=A0A078AU09_STYLE|nr:UNKNOWN [Stylonychia lemnae]|eukprot:CDW85461.1 UNKNOWN [Stylonychia lemnae]